MKEIQKILISFAIITSMLFAPLTVYATENEEPTTDASSEGSEVMDDDTDSNPQMDNEEESEEETYVESTVENAVDAKNGVVQINCIYVDDDGNSHIIKGATGFLVGTTGENPKQYLITSKQGIIADKSTRKAALKSFGVKKDDMDNKIDNISYEIVVTKDMSISCSLYKQSDELDMAVFTLGENLANRKPLSIYTSDDGFTNDLPYKVTDYVHSIGLPDSISYDGNLQKYDKKNIVISSGKIVNIHSLNDVYIISHDADVGANNCGGPLVNENGDVIGMNILKKDGQYSVAIDSTEIVDVLDSFGIEYNKMSPGTVKPTEESSVDASVIYVTTGGDTEGGNNEETVNKLPIGLLIALISVIVILIIVCLILFITKPFLSEDEKNRRANERAEKKMQKAAMKANKNMPERPFPTVDSKNLNANQSGGTGMETNMLGGADAGTMVLSGGPVMNKPQSGGMNAGTLIRKKTGDNIILCKPETTFGKDSLHVDYCIRDNSAISRVHAVFTVNAQGVCIVDKNSTNGTFVNGTKLGANESRMLNKGDIVRLANEEFEYRK